MPNHHRFIWIFDVIILLSQVFVLLEFLTRCFQRRFLFKVEIDFLFTVLLKRVVCVANCINRAWLVGATVLLRKVKDCICRVTLNDVAKRRLSIF